MIPRIFGAVSLGMLPRSAQAWFDAQSISVADVESRVSSQGTVVVVSSRGGERFVVKQASGAAIERERRGLDAASSVGGVPRVLAQLEPTALLLSWHAGVPSETPDAMRAAGRWLRRLHGQGVVESDPLPVRDALVRRRDGWLDRAVDLPVESVAAATFEAFGRTTRVLCHRDFTPSNWLWEPERGVVVIDFGQSRADAGLWDLVKLEGDLFEREPSLRESFYEGYGPVDRSAMKDLLLLHGLQTAAWGDAHGDPEFSALGRRLLASGSKR